MIMREIRSPKNTIEWENYYDLRYRVLRLPWNQPLSSTKTPEDETAEHFALYNHNELRAIARLDILENHKAQIRFVATEPNYQGQGYGKELMLAIEEYCQANNINEIILEARENAVNFYLSLDYERLEEGKLLFEEIKHWWMRKGW